MSLRNDEFVQIAHRYILCDWGRPTSDLCGQRAIWCPRAPFVYHFDQPNYLCDHHYVAFNTLRRMIS